VESESALERILRRGAAAPAQEYDGDQLDLEERESLRRVIGLSTELEDITDVEYRQLRIEKVILIGVWSQGNLTAAENSLRELSALAETAGARVLDGLLQRRNMPDPTSYLGKGKAAELRDLARSLGADTVIANTELSPSQRRSLEDIVKIKVIDRTAIILDIFAQHAKSKEGNWGGRFLKILLGSFSPFNFFSSALINSHRSITAPDDSILSLSSPNTCG